MSNEVRDYLADMGMPENIIEKMFATGSDEILYIDRELVESINKVSFFDEWIKANCKTLSKEEYEDYFFQSAMFRYMPEKFSKSEKSYYDYLKEKYLKYEECYFKKLMEAQQKVKLPKQNF